MLKASAERMVGIVGWVERSQEDGSDNSGYILWELRLCRVAE